MKRTQYVDSELSEADGRPQREGTISEPVRQATRQHHLADLEERRAAMQAFVGVRKDRPEFRNAVAYVRGLRRSRRLRCARI